MPIVSLWSVPSKSQHHNQCLLTLTRQSRMLHSTRRVSTLEPQAPVLHARPTECSEPNRPRRADCEGKGGGRSLCVISFPFKLGAGGSRGRPAAPPTRRSPTGASGARTPSARCSPVCAPSSSPSLLQLPPMVTGGFQTSRATPSVLEGAAKINETRVEFFYSGRFTANRPTTLPDTSGIRNQESGANRWGMDRYSLFRFA